MVWTRQGKFTIADIHVYEWMRNKGYGERILKEIKQMACDREIHRIWLNVFKTNPAFRLYQRCGFHVEVEEENGYLMS